MRHSLFSTGDKSSPVVLSYGMGVDSTALLLRWLREPESRDFDLSDLVVLSAQTGDEFKDTQRLVQRHILPLLGEFRVRFVQVARAGPREQDGVVVLDDSRQPDHLFIDGRFKLSQELLDNGTVPQVATGQRRCTHHFKGFPLTSWTDREFGSQQVRKVIGYNADERGRANRSEGYATDTRPIEYPLIEWEWGRAQCEAYVLSIAGETWKKSLCVMCPFAGGKPDILERYRQFPDEAADALFLEYVSLAMNPRAPLYGRFRLESVLRADGNTEAFRRFEQRLSAGPWAIYRVRRIVWGRGRADRKTERIAEGDYQAMTSELLGRGAHKDGRHVRLQLRTRTSSYPCLEEMLVAAPAVVSEKCRPSFEGNWHKFTTPTLWE